MIIRKIVGSHSVPCYGPEGKEHASSLKEPEHPIIALLDDGDFRVGQCDYYRHSGNATYCGIGGATKPCKFDRAKIDLIE